MSLAEKWLAELSLEEKVSYLSYVITPHTKWSLVTKENERVGVPYLSMTDGPHGLKDMQWRHKDIDGGSVCFPTSSSIAASWNTELAYKIGTVLASECRAQCNGVLLAPAINMKRIPNCGRNFEYYSEDPVLAGDIGAEFVKGLQDHNVGACVKHFAANNQETNRNTISAEVDERTLREIYLKAFERIIKKAKPSMVMCAYNRLNGEYCSENHWLLTELLRDTWHFDGVVVSDWGAVHNPCKALAAGVDLRMPADASFSETILKGFKDGQITEEMIDRSALRVLKLIEKYHTGYDRDGYDRLKHHKIAKTVSDETIVLLKNENNALPINIKKIKKLCVIGNAAIKPVIQGMGSSRAHTDEDWIETPLECIQEICGDEVELEFIDIPPMAEPGTYVYKATAAAKSADRTLMFLTAGLESESYDRNNLRLESHLEAALNMVSSCDNVTLILQTGSSILPGRWHQKLDSIIQAGLYGESGARSLVDIIFGKVNPSAKLSETYPMTERQDMDTFGNDSFVHYSEGFDVGYRYYDKHPDDVWFPFGHGLSYTEFEYSELTVTVYDKKITASVKIKNVGEVFGSEVVQLYVTPAKSFVYRPSKELKAFCKVKLNPRESKMVTLEIEKDDLAYFNINSHEWSVASGKYGILVGASSVDIRLTADVEI